MSYLCLHEFKLQYGTVCLLKSTRSLVQGDAQDKKAGQEFWLNDS